MPFGGPQPSDRIKGSGIARACSKNCFGTAIRSGCRDSPVEYFRGDPPARHRQKAANPRGAVLMVSFGDRATAPAHVLVRYLDKESVLLNLETEKYFGLDETGTRMWQVVTAAPSIDAAYQELQNEFDVESELLRLHFTELLGRLVDNGLLQIQPTDVGTASAV